MKETIWVLCGRTQVWHRLSLGYPPDVNSSEVEPPMAALSCGHDDTTGSWFILKEGGDLPPMGAVCDYCWESRQG